MGMALCLIEGLLCTVRLEIDEVFGAAAPRSTFRPHPLTPPWRSARAQNSLRPGHLFSNLEEMLRSDCLGEFELMVLLAVIRLDADAYGVTISREIEQRSGRAVSLGGVYAALDRMEERGLVTSRLGDPTAARGGRAKRFFRATSDGIGAARETRNALVSLWTGLRQLGPQGGRA